MDGFLEDIIHQDQELLVYLHRLGSQPWDAFWIFITNPLHWIPLFIFFFYLGYKTYKTKKAVLILMWTSLAVITALGLMQLIKTTFQRLRPIHEPRLNTMVRKIVSTDGFSFISGHSMVSAAIATMIYLTLRKRYKFSFLIFLFPLLFAYSRIYLAVHYPLDVFFGILAGIIIGKLFFIPIKKFLYN